MTKGVTAAINKWLELSEKYPEGNENAGILFESMALLSSGKHVEKCITHMRSNISCEKLIILFLHLATAYLEANLEDKNQSPS